eukprot:1653586-Prymnesium_polylepis.1
MAFHRPNERCHLKAKRMLPFGLAAIEATFPWASKPSDQADEDAPQAQPAGGAAGGAPEQAPSSQPQPPVAKEEKEKEEALLLES